MRSALLLYKDFNNNSPFRTDVSSLLSNGDIVEITDKAKKISLISDSITKMEREVPSYIEVNTQELSAKYNAVPSLEDVPYPVIMDVNLVVEFYSR